MTLQSRIPAIARAIDDELDTAMRRGAEDVAELAQALAPRSDGPGPHLADVIHVERVSIDVYHVVAGDGGDVFYGHLVEFGSAAGGKGRPPIPPHPFLIPALEASRDNILRRGQDALEDL